MTLLLCDHRAPASCAVCDGDAADEQDVVDDRYGPVASLHGPHFLGCPLWRTHQPDDHTCTCDRHEGGTAA